MHMSMRWSVAFIQHERQSSLSTEKELSGDGSTLLCVSCAAERIRDLDPSLLRTA